uniref:Protein-serine O-palmitoleoyltransferase porcupine n=1 Tax=Ascaris suum TaxID=6253 RepID=F1L3I1_ASCSU
MDVDQWYLEEDDVYYISDQHDYPQFVTLQSERPQWLMCTMGVAQSLQYLLVKLIAFALLKRLLVAVCNSGKLNPQLLNICMAICGMYMLWAHNETLAHVVAFVVVLLPVVYFGSFLTHRSGFIAISFGIGCLLLWQYILSAERYMSMRGTLMVIVMKVTSLCFDIVDEGVYDNSALPTLLGYLFDPCTVLFGPWISLRQYDESLKKKPFKEEVMSQLYAMLLIVVSLIFVVYSSCIIELIFPISGFWHSFGVAQSFRFSHYFMCWLSVGSAIASGAMNGMLTDCISIEWPRSLVDVVVSWSIPMHRFLQKYVFTEMRRYGAASAIFVTYAVSSLLHGINFQLSAVLLSLGLYTFVETRIRSKLSARFSACIGARKCRHDCAHIRKEGATLTVLLNVSFRVLAMVHLVYLGMVFDDSAAETGYSANHTLSVWASWHFGSHAVAVIMLFVSFLL